MRKKHQDNAARHGGVGNIEDRPARQLVAEDIHIEKVGVDEIDHLPVEERRIIKDHAIKYTIDKITDGTAQDKSECDTECKVLVACFVEIEKDADARKDGEDGKEQLSPQVDAESHTGVFDIGEPEKIAEDRPAASEWQSLDMDSQRLDVDSLYRQFCDLIGKDDKDTEVEYFHYNARNSYR